MKNVTKTALLGIYQHLGGRSCELSNKKETQTNVVGKHDSIAKIINGEIPIDNFVLPPVLNTTDFDMPSKEAIV